MEIGHVRIILSDLDGTVRECKDLPLDDALVEFLKTLGMNWGGLG